MEAIEDYIKKITESGDYDPDCKTCKNVIQPELVLGFKLSDIFCPNHKPSKNCKSGKRPHCTCDACF